MKLSNQAIGAIMMALQESLMNQSDIVPVFQKFELTDTNDGLVVDNPPQYMSRMKHSLTLTLRNAALPL